MAYHSSDLLSRPVLAALWRVDDEQLQRHAPRQPERDAELFSKNMFYCNPWRSIKGRVCVTQIVEPDVEAAAARLRIFGQAEDVHWIDG